MHDSMEHDKMGLNSFAGHQWRSSTLCCARVIPGLRGSVSQVEAAIKGAAKKAEDDRRKGAAKERQELEKTMAEQLNQVRHTAPGRHIKLQAVSRKAYNRPWGIRACMGR